MRNQPAGRRTLRLAAVVQRHSLSRFALFGLLGLAVDLALVLALAAATPWPDVVVVTVAFLVTYGGNFALNRAFAFRARERLVPQLLRFAPQLAVDWLLVVVAVEALTGLGLALLPARFLAAGTNAVFKYATYRWWTFHPGEQQHRPVRREGA